VHLAYIDESETRSGVFIFGAMLVTAHQAIQVSGALDQLMKNAEVEVGISASTELHARELFGRSKAWKGVPKRYRLYLLERAVNAIAGAGAVACFRGIDNTALKEYQLKQHQPSSPTIEQEALKHLLQRIDSRAKQLDDHTVVIADDRADADSLRDALTSYRTKGTSGIYKTRMDNIIDTLTFVPSHYSRSIQAIDLLTYFYRRRIEVPTESIPEREAVVSRICAVIDDLTFDEGIWP
jgi:hypothetical protein